MEQTAKTKTIKIVCIVLAAIVVATALAAGLFVYFNSNTFRFRMSVFRGEYVPAYKIGSFDPTTIAFPYEDQSPGSIYGDRICVVEDGKAVIKEYVTEVPGELELIYDTTLDANISEVVKKYGYIFDSDCTIYNDKVVFGNYGEMKIIDNKYYNYEKYGKGNGPVREITVVDENGIEFTLYCSTSFIKSGLFNIYPLRTFISMESQKIVVKTTSGEDKKITIVARYLIKNNNIEGIRK